MTYGALATASVAAAANFTWSGAAAVGEQKWSNGTNWSGTAPNASVGTLTFPVLTSAACTANPPKATCYSTENDISGLTVNALSFALPEHNTYFLFGKAITLGAGGVIATTSGNKGAGDACVFLPITLGASQSWSVDGNNVFGELGVSQVQGESSALSVTLSHKGELATSCSSVEGFEVGGVTATGGDKTLTGRSAFENGTIALTGGSELNATDTKPVTIMDAALWGSPSAPGQTETIGPLTFTGGELTIGSVGSTGVLTVAGGVTFDSKSGMVLGVDSPGTVAGVDYSQLSAGGAVKLEGAELLLQAENSDGHCPTLKAGDVDTLVTTKGSLTGTFAGIPNGATVPVVCISGKEPTVRINYTERAVTATALSSGPPPTVEKVSPKKGHSSGGTMVTITGTNLNGATKVNFGATDATSFKVNSPTSIAAVSPAGPKGTVNVAVTTPNGTSASSKKDHFRYVR